MPEERQPVVAGLVEVLSRPDGRALVTGEPGVGKTTMVDAALGLVRRTGSLRVLRAHAGHAHRLPYLGMHDLFADVDLDAVGLPAPQRAALEQALGRGGDDVALSANAVFVAADALVRALLDTGPVALVIDHLDGLDAETYALMCYLSSRHHPGGGASFIATQATVLAVTDEPVVESSCFRPEEVVHVTPLRPDSLAAVLRSRVPGGAPPYDAHELWTRTGGNPLWALELITRSADPRTARGPSALRDLLRRREPVASEPFPQAVDLSVRERAVALAAAGGRTNREIAAAEFVSVRTVETQLSSAYRKLGVRSRTELTALLHRRADGPALHR